MPIELDFRKLETGNWCGPLSVKEFQTVMDTGISVSAYSGDPALNFEGAGLLSSGKRDGFLLLSEFTDLPRELELKPYNFIIRMINTFGNKKQKSLSDINQAEQQLFYEFSIHKPTEDKIEILDKYSYLMKNKLKIENT